MPSLLAASLVIVSTAISQSVAFAIPQQPAEPQSFNQFTRLVAFGDELSDNGNGSYAHGITGNPADVYGFGTWTNGPVAVSYLADLLNLPLDDYAFGGCCGGESFGATIGNGYTPAEAQWNGKPVPSVRDQMFKNYTNPAPSSILTSLQFIWVGQNDLSKHTNAFWEGDPKNAEFATEISERITKSAERLIDQGAPAVFVANIYPKHRAPATIKYLCPDGGCVEAWGRIIQSANEAIKSSLANSKYSNQLIYYDGFSFMVDLMDRKESEGLTQPLTDYCDGDPAEAKWDTCIAGDYTWEGAEKFFWMNFIQPTAHVHRLIAKDMKARLSSVLGI